MPPTTAARWMIRSGRAAARSRVMSDSLRRSCSRLRGATGSTRRARSAATTNDPRKPAPPVTTTRLPAQNPGMLGLAAVAVPRQIGVDHEPDEIDEPDLRHPAQLVPRLGGVAQQEVDFRGPPQCRVDHDVLAPVEPRVREGQLHQLLHGVRLPRGHHVVVGLVLLQHEPHRLHVIAGEAPVPPRFQVAEPQLLLQPAGDPGHPVGDLARDELQPPPRRLALAQDPAGAWTPPARPAGAAAWARTAAAPGDGLRAAASLRSGG